MFICYPLKTLNLIEKEKTTQDVIFNVHLLKDISKVGFDAFTRYIFGRNISSIKNIDKIYSWSEFQVVERAFNYGIRKYSNIIINACQFYINYPIYFNSFVQDIDELGGYAPHKVLVNGRYYLRKCENIKYELGVSFRYAKIFEYKKQNTGNNIVVLGSYLIDETKNTLELVKIFDNIIFKSHPTVDNSNFKDQIERNTQVTNEDIYDLFPKALIIVGNASGSLVEAVACGVSVIVLARENELIPNPLVDFGKGEIWDIAFNKKELIDRCQQLLIYRKNNPDKINVIAAWYKDNFFIEPTKENISKVFF
jgi:hypothetical protein